MAKQPKRRPRPPTVPPQAAAAGYNRKTFTSDFRNNWYLWSFFGGMSSPSHVTFNSDGSVTLQGDTTGPNGQIATGRMTSTGFIGASFGGGAYFESTFMFYPQTVIDRNFQGWPSFWSMAREHLAQEPAQQWPGQPPGYDHFIEADFFEYDTYPYNHWPNGYGACLHDYSGIYPNYMNNFSDPTAAAPQNVDFRQYHKYGMLWVPATLTKAGYAEFYFDDAKIGNRPTWTLIANPTPTNYSQFAIMDKQHLVMILGTGVGMPMTVKSVNVWQK